MQPGSHNSPWRFITTGLDCSVLWWLVWMSIQPKFNSAMWSYLDALVNEIGYWCMPIYGYVCDPDWILILVLAATGGYWYWWGPYYYLYWYCQGSSIDNGTGIYTGIAYQYWNRYQYWPLSEYVLDMIPALASDTIICMYTSITSTCIHLSYCIQCQHWSRY